MEENLIEKRARVRSKKRVTYKYDNTPTTSSSDTKIDNLAKVIERMLEKINLNDRVPPRETQNNSQNKNRNQNYRRENNQDR